MRCITGKRELKTYYKERGLLDTDVYEADGGVDTAEHALWHCEMHREERDRLLKIIGKKGADIS